MDAWSEYLEGFVENPAWDEAGRVHDWRNHVPMHIKDMWGTFSPEHRRALIKWADSLASSEHWD